MKYFVCYCESREWFLWLVTWTMVGSGNGCDISLSIFFFSFLFFFPFPDQGLYPCLCSRSTLNSWATREAPKYISSCYSWLFLDKPKLLYLKPLYSLLVCFMTLLNYIFHSLASHFYRFQFYQQNMSFLLQRDFSPNSCFSFRILFSVVVIWFAPS